MIRRSRRSLPATLAALALLGAAVLVSIASIQHLLSRPPILSLHTLVAATVGRSWADPVVMGAGALAVVLGLILLAAALLPGRPTVLPLAHDPTGTGTTRSGAGVSRRSLRKDLTTTTLAADGARAATLKVGRRRITATVRTPAADTGELREQVRTLLTDRLVDIAPARTPTVRVHARGDRKNP